MFTIKDIKQNEKGIKLLESNFSAISKPKPPIERGHIVDWDMMTAVWAYLYYEELRICPEEHALIMNYEPQIPQSNRAKTTEIFFEQLNVPAIFIASSHCLALVATGRITGCVLKIGAQVCSSAAVLDGAVLPHTVNAINGISGVDISLNLKRLLIENEIEVSAQTVEYLKHQYGSVALSDDDKAEEAKAEEEYELPDGTRIKIESRLFNQSTECLFNPSLNGIDTHSLSHHNIHGVHQMVNNSILNNKDLLVRMNLWRSMILNGGTTLLPNFAERFEKEMRILQPTYGTRVVKQPERRYTVWIGSSILASLNIFEREKMWISREDYDEYGASIAYHKLFL